MTVPIDLRCPRCQSRRLVLGELAYGRTLGPAENIHFRALSARFPAVRQGVAVRGSGFCCAMCGLFWGELMPHELEAHLARFATYDVKVWLRDKPDAPLP